MTNARMAVPPWPACIRGGLSPSREGRGRSSAAPRLRVRIAVAVKGSVRQRQAMSRCPLRFAKTSCAKRGFLVTNYWVLSSIDSGRNGSWRHPLQGERGLAERGTGAPDTGSVLHREAAMETFGSLSEFHEAIEALIASLRDGAHALEADILDHRMHRASWTTSSELLEELAQVLGGMSGAYPENARSMIHRCRHFAERHRRVLKLDR